MNDAWVTTKAVLLEHLERDWTAINRLLDALTETQWLSIHNPDGWTVKDHVAHLTAWDSYVIAFLQRRPLHEGLGVPDALYRSGEIDAINHAIFQAHREDPLDQVKAQFAVVHAELLDLIAPLPEAEFGMPARHYQPDEAEEDDYRVIDVVYGSTAYHYREHQLWIEQMLASAEAS